MTRTTRRDIDRMAGHVVDHLAALDMLPDDYHDVTVSPGSPTYGRSWRIFYTRPKDTGHHVLHPFTDGWPVGGYLGMTKSDAFETLATVRDTLSAVCHTQGVTVTLATADRIAP